MTNKKLERSNKNSTIIVRIATKHKETAMKLANVSGISLSEWVRNLIIQYTERNPEELS